MPELREHTHEECPNCGESLCAGLIVDTIVRGEHHPQPYTLEEIQDMYGDGRCYSLRVDITMRGEDYVSYWLYPCCSFRTHRQF